MPKRNSNDTCFTCSHMIGDDQGATGYCTQTKTDKSSGSWCWRHKGPSSVVESTNDEIWVGDQLLGSITNYHISNGNGLLEEQPTWSVLDSTKLDDYMQCPRRYFYRYVLGWRPEAENSHLIFGQAWHFAMQHLLEYGYAPESIALAFAKLNDYYRSIFPENTDEVYYPKVPARALEALAKYCIVYREDRFNVLYTEIAGTVPINTNGRKMHFKMDSILEDLNNEGLVTSLEHKTAKDFGRTWVDKWAQAIQPGTYNHALYCLYPEERVWGVKINGTAFFKNVSRKEGDNVAFKRVPARRTYDMLNDWLFTVNAWYDELERDMNKLLGGAENDNVLQCFKKNPVSCTDYFGCTYLYLCTTWPNPLHYLDSLPSGFKIEHWDPRVLEDESKYIVRGSEIIQKEVGQC
jgi:hypothetical protein